jgi:twitching motility protein PilT
MVPAYEIMRMTDAVSNLVRENKTHQLDNAIAGGRKDGMITMDQSILELFQAGQITLETAVTYADNPEQMKRRIGS